MVAASESYFLLSQRTHPASQKPKSIPDTESKGAVWMSLRELEEKANIPPPEGLRGRELLEWPQYIENGGQIFPLHLLAEEHDPIVMPE